MKKVLKAELTSLAHQILQLKSAEDISNLKALTGKLYDKLAILEFTDRHFDGAQSTIKRKDIVETLRKDSANASQELSLDVTETNNETDDKIEKIRRESQPEVDKIASPEKLEHPKTLSVEEQDYNDRQRRLEALENKNYLKNDVAHIGGVSYDDLPEFEPVPSTEQPQQPKQEPKAVETYNTLNSPQNPSKKSKSVNDLNRGIKIGLNDRIAFIKHLFDGNAGDYNRVLSQLNTLETKDKAQDFLELVVKPDYNNWVGKELYEERLKEIVNKKFS